MLEFNATFIVAMLSFIVFIIVMNTIFYKPILSIIDERQRFIDDNLKHAKNSKQKAEEILKQKENRLNQALSKSRKLVSDNIENANKQSKTLIDNAKIKSAQEIQKAKENLNNNKEEMLVDLKNKIIKLAEDISSKILGEDVNIENIDYEILDKEMK